MSLNLEGFGLQIGNRGTASDFTWTLGVAQGCNCRSILDAIASLIEAQRPELVLVLIEQELNSQTSLTQHGVSSTYFGHLMRNYGD